MSNEKAKEVLKNPAMARATQRGYFGQVIEQGEEFLVPAGTEKESSWFEIIEELPEGDKRRESKNDSKGTSK